MKRRLKENIEINDEVLVDVGPFGEKYQGTDFCVFFNISNKG